MPSARALIAALLGESLSLELQAPRRLEAEAVAESFREFVRSHGRAYREGSEEYRERLVVFGQRLAEVEAHNSRPRRRWTAGINEHADHTSAELRRLRGWRGGTARGAARGSSADVQPRLPGTSFLSVQALPKSMNWTQLEASKHIISQGGCGSCWAVTTTTLLRAHVEIYRSEYRAFSTQELLSCMPNPMACGGTGGCQGATVELAMDFVSRHGLLTEQEMPYKRRTGSCSLRLPNVSSTATALSLNTSFMWLLTKPGTHLVETGSPSTSFGMLGWERLGENAYEPLLRAVVERGPVGVSVAATSRWNIYSHGIFDDCPRDAVIDHAVVLIGFGEGAKSNDKYWLIQNSWGKSWGEHGLIRLLRSDSDDLPENCGVDSQPELGTGCVGGPAKVKVCGMCGVLYDSVVPHFA